MKLLKNTIVKNILLSFCGVISIGTVGATVYNTVLVENLKQQNNEIISILEEKDNKISNLQQQLEETKTTLTEVPKQSTDEKTTEETKNITSNSNTSNIKAPLKSTQSASTHENTRETRKQELIKQRDELQKQIDSKKNELKNQTQSLKAQADPLYNKYLELKNKASDELSKNGNTSQYKQLFQEQQDYERQYKEIDQKIFDLKHSGSLHNDIINFSKQLQDLQQQINEL